MTESGVSNTIANGNLPEGVSNDKYCQGYRSAPRGAPGCAESSAKAWGSYFGSGKVDSRSKQSHARNICNSCQASPFRGRAQENFSGPESTLGQDQADQESS